MHFPSSKVTRTILCYTDADFSFERRTDEDEDDEDEEGTAGPVKRTDEFILQ